MVNFGTVGSLPTQFGREVCDLYKLPLSLGVEDRRF